MVLAFAGDSTITRLPSISVFLDSSVKPPSAGLFLSELQSNEQSWQFSKFFIKLNVISVIPACKILILVAWLEIFRRSLQAADICQTSNKQGRFLIIAGKLIKFIAYPQKYLSLFNAYPDLYIQHCLMQHIAAKQSFRKYITRPLERVK